MATGRARRSASTWARLGVGVVALGTLAAGVAGRSSGDTLTTTGTGPGTTQPVPVAATAERSAGASGTASVLADPAGFQQPWGSAVQGLLTFRGNPTRSFDGLGPVPSDPVVAWRSPRSGRMCHDSTEYHITKLWCGTGWTGQPAVFERGGRTWVVFGAYDAKIHFLDAATGEDLLPPLETGDIAKGAITIDPDGYPLVYAGSRDNLYRVIAIDRPTPTVLWSMDAAQIPGGVWNDDWDGAGLVVRDHLIEGGENSRLHLVKLNRGYGSDGLVTAAPQLVWNDRGWDDQLLHDVGDHRFSLESSVMLLGDTVYVANSGGLVQGWDFSSIRTGIGTPHRTFRFWTGDDTDATIVGDAEGYLYVGVEVDRVTARGKQVGQLLKLDPRQPDDPVVWSVDVDHQRDDGTWSTPAIVGGTVVWPTKPGDVYGLDRATGAIRWKLHVPGPILGSPTVVDQLLLLGDSAGVLHAWDVGDGTAAPTPRWTITLGGTVESTAAVWKGRIFLGTRDGAMFAVADRTAVGASG